MNGWLIALLALAGWMLLSLILALFLGRIIRLGQHRNTDRGQPKTIPIREVRRRRGGRGRLRMAREIA